MHLNHVRDCIHKERSLWYGTSLILKIQLKTMRILESIRYDIPPEIKILVELRSFEKSRVGG